MNLRIVGWAIGSLLWLGGAGATANILSVDVVSSVPGEILPGYVTNDVLVDFDSMIVGQQLSLRLTQGSIFQAAEFGSDTAPLAYFSAQSPELPYDSFVTMGGLDAESSAPVLTVGGAVDLAWQFNSSVSRSVIFDAATADIAWAAQPGTRILSGEDFLTARLTLSADAQGSFRYLSSAKGSNNFWIGEAQIVNGTIENLTRRLAEPVVPVTTPPVVPPVMEVVAPVTPEPKVDPLPPQVPPVVIDVPPSEPVAVDPVEEPLQEGSIIGWIPPRFIDLPFRTFPTDRPSLDFKLWSLIDESVDATYVSQFTDLYDGIRAFDDDDDSTSNGSVRAIQSILTNSRAGDFGMVAVSQKAAFGSTIAPEPCSQTLLLISALIASARRKRR